MGSFFYSKINYMVVVSCVCLTGCITMPNRFSSLAPGEWRAELQLTERGIATNQLPEKAFAKFNIPFTEASEGALPFLMEVKYQNDTTFHINIINGSERVPISADEIHMGHDRRTGKDTILIQFPIYASFIRAAFNEKIIEGSWVVPAKNLEIPFVARHGQNHRFTTLAKTPKTNLTGNWETTFGVGSDDIEKAIGEFQQKGNRLYATFRTETGDYRFLEGEIQEDKVYLSCFDAAHAYLFEAKCTSADTMQGIFRSGKNAPIFWQAVRNPQFKLRSADSLTVLKTGYKSLDFNFKNADGKEISLKNQEYVGKVKIIQILGTWCPNCRDETRFLVGYLRENPGVPVAVIGLAFERNPITAIEQIKTYRTKMNIPYEIVLACTSTKKEEAAKALPALNHILSYPTTIFMDKKGNVRRIHTGFDGPATSAYNDFVKEFDTFVKQLAAE